MSKTVLITRARGDEHTLTEALHDAQLNVIHEPLTEIILLHTARSALEYALQNEPDAILITSRHGVRALASLTTLRDLPLLCVGEATLEAAFSLGFHRAVVTGETADDMIEYVRSAYDDDAKFIYPSAEHVNTDLVEALAQFGMSVERVVVYEAQAVASLSDILLEHIKHGQIDAITFLSGRAAKIFTELAENTGIKNLCHKIHACCMSENIASGLEKTAWKAIHIAHKPTLASVAECVDNALR
jgi:uroporphyrinogen-III synthase